MTSKYYKVIQKDNIVLAKVINRSGTFIIVPPSWEYKECYVYFPDFYIERKLVKRHTYNYTVVNVASIYVDQILLARLIQQ